MYRVRGNSMQSRWKPRKLPRLSFGKRPPLPPKQLLYVAAILSAAAVALSTGIAAYTALTGLPVEEQAGDRWFLEKIRYDAGSSPVARSRADFIAGCYKMWRHSLARLMDISCRNESLQRWLTHSRARHRLMPAAPFIRPRSILKCVLSLSVRVLLFMLLVVAGDVERNPGPLSQEDLERVSDKELTTEDLYDVLEEVIDLKGKWIDILAGLRLPPSLRSTIRAEHPADSLSCLVAVLVMWLSKRYNVERYGPPSWRTLVKAVADPIGGREVTLAWKIAGKYPAAIQSSNPADLRRALSVKMSGSGGEVGGEDGGVSDASESSADLSGQLIRASIDGDLGKVKYLVKIEQVDPHSCRDGDNDDTPLHCASRYGHLDIVRYLVEEQQCDVKCRNKNGNTPLHDAAYGGRLDIVQYLISERGCDPMCRGRYGRTPLHTACQKGELNVVKYLMEDVKVDMSCRDDGVTGATPLHIAAWLGTLDVVQYMIEEQQCDVECRDKNGNTPLHSAAFEGRLDIVQYLISERGCDPMCRGWYGRTPLHTACQKGKLNVVKYLVEDVKIEPSCRDEYDVTPLHTASRNGHLSVVRLLVEDYLCDPAVRDNDGDTPADWAQEKGHTHITSYLSSIEKIVSTDLRRALVAQLKPYTRKARPTGTVLGSGTYGSVIELTSARETVAGKVFKTSSTIRLQAVANRVCGELIMMTQLHHPNVVQCKGVSLLTDQTLPVLLMERLMSSLHAYLLDPRNSNLPLERKVSILRDVASGLAYLHSHTPAIIHRDLTAKNVLLDSELTAKIADFGNSRIMDLDPAASPETFTSLPGTLEYMPPEAHGGSAKYDPSLDVFSFGHLALFTITQAPPRPLLSYSYTDSTGEVRGRSEVKRREEFVEKAEQLLSENHSLVAVIKQCLHNNPAQRPRTGELLTRLQEMLTSEMQEQVRRDQALDIDNLFEVNSELIDVAVRWRYIGLALHLKDPKLSIIQDNNADVTTRLTDMLRQWLNKTYDVEQFGQPSWQMLAEAVKSQAGGDNPALAAKMARKHFVILA